MPSLPRRQTPAPGPDPSARLLVLLGSTPSEPGWTPSLVAREQPVEDHAQPEPDSSRQLREPPPTSVRELLAASRVNPGRQGVLALVAVALVAAAVAGFLLVRGHASEEPLEAPATAGAVVSSAGPQLVVDVAGKVRHPGLVHLAAGARVDDALRAAGGVLPGTSTGALNLARKVADGEQVLVGVEGTAPGATTGAGGLLDLNEATAAQLDALPGIGPVLADKIVSWRTAHGRFASIDQLREVGGIGESKYQALKTKVRV